MAPPPATPPDNERLTRYLLGSASQDEAEAIEEGAMVDDEAAWQLDAAENELVDRYSRGELSGETLRLFEQHYLASPRRQQKVRFAQALAARTSSASRGSTGLATSRAARRVLSWPLAAAAALVVVASGVFVIQRSTPEDQPVAPDRSGGGASAAGGSVQAPALPRGTETVAPPRRESRVVFSLAAPLRGRDTGGALVIPTGATEVQMNLELEADEFPRYRASLRDTAADRVVWRSTGLDATRTAAVKVVEVVVPADRLAAGTYVMDLEGFSRSGEAEPLGAYAFRVTRAP